MQRPSHEGCPSRDQLSKLLSEELRDAQQDSLETHLSTCDHCQKTLFELTEHQESEWKKWERLLTDQSDCPAELEIAAHSQFDVPGYEILEELGRGGMGVIYKARDLELQRLVAIKMLLGAGFAGPERLTRFQNEARAIARISHPNIVKIHQVGCVDELPFLVLELIEGPNLSEVIRGMPQDPVQSARLVRQIADAVAAAHQNEVVHRDIKPSNVLVDCSTTHQSETKEANASLVESVPKLTDFGLAKHLDQDGVTRTEQMLGTPSYIAPEAISAEPADETLLDVYAVGTVLYELLTGRPPFRASTALETLD